MTSYRPVDSKREEFRKYLEKAGAMDALTKVLVMLYDEPEKPADALDYIRKHLGDNNRPDDAELNVLKSDLEESRLKIQTLEDQIRVLKERLAQYEPEEFGEMEEGLGSEPTKTLTEQTKTVSESSKTVTEPTKTVSDPTKTVSDPTKTVSDPTKTVSDPTKTVAESTKTVAEPTKTVAEPTKTVAEPTKTLTEPTKTVSDKQKTVLGSADDVGAPAEGADEA